jgi:hypothetical protein
VEGVKSGGQLITKGNIEFTSEGGAMAPMSRNPGAVLTNATKNKSAITIPDYNGDKCRIPYGMTVRVDEFGQFVPEMAPGAKESKGPAAGESKKAPTKDAPK